MIRSDHPRIVDLHSMISINKNGFKGNFIEAYEGKCAYCGASLQVISRTQFEVDHLIPRTATFNDVYSYYQDALWNNEAADIGTNKQVFYVKE